MVNTEELRDNKPNIEVKEVGSSREILNCYNSYQLLKEELFSKYNIEEDNVDMLFPNIDR
jgi:hypothetical protein